MLITFRAILFEHDLGTTVSTIKIIFTWMNYYNYSSTYEIPSVFHVLFPKIYLNKLEQISIDWSSWLFKFFGFDELNWIFFFSSFFFIVAIWGCKFFCKSFCLKWQLVTVWKVSKYGVFSGPYFLAFGLNT